MVRQITTVVVEEVEMAVYLDSNGGIFAIDASYVDQEAGPCFNPFTGCEFKPD